MSTQEYHGDPLASADYQFLVDLEEIIRQPIPKGRPNSVFGYVSEEQHIIQLMLFEDRVFRLPPSIGKLSSLTKLRLDLTIIRELPEELFEVDSLKELILAKNIYISELSESLGKLGQLEQLYIESTSIKQLPTTITQVPLTSLILIDNPLYPFPEMVFRIKTLEQLVLNGMLFPVLPPGISQLLHLTMLELGGLGLSTLSPEIFTLPQLKRLSLNENKLAEIPVAIAQLTHLNYLSVSENQLTAIPEVLCHFTELKTLVLHHNQLTTLPPNFGELVALESLYLNINHLTALPNSIGKLTQLKDLHLEMNALPSLPESFCNLTELSFLDLTKNALSALPFNIGNLVGLKKVRLNFNPLTSLPPSIRSLDPNLDIRYIRCPFREVATGWQDLQLIYGVTFQEAFDLLCARPHDTQAPKYITRLRLEHPVAFLDLITRKLSDTEEDSLHKFLESLLDKLTVAQDNGTELLL